MIEYQIISTRFNENDVRIDFRGIDEYNQISLNGYVPVTTAEFFQNSGSMTTLSALVKAKVLERLNGTAT